MIWLVHEQVLGRRHYLGYIITKMFILGVRFIGPLINLRVKSFHRPDQIKNADQIFGKRQFSSYRKSMLMNAIHF